MGRSNEQLVQNQIRLACGRGPVRLFRNNTGALKDSEGRLVRFGLAPGSSDLIGWKTVEVTPDMVGSSLAVFVALEVKDGGRATERQIQFIKAVESAGGIAGVVRDVPQATQLLYRM